MPAQAWGGTTIVETFADPYQQAVYCKFITVQHGDKAQAEKWETRLNYLATDKSEADKEALEIATRKFYPKLQKEIRPEWRRCSSVAKEIRKDGSAPDIDNTEQKSEDGDAPDNSLKDQDWDSLLESLKEAQEE